LQKELKDIKLLGDSLHDLEIFWDSILGAFTNICQVDQAYHYYRDLSTSFTFENHLVASVIPPKYLPLTLPKQNVTTALLGTPFVFS